MPPAPVPERTLCSDEPASMPPTLPLLRSHVQVPLAGEVRDCWKLQLWTACQAASNPDCCEQMPKHICKSCRIKVAACRCTTDRQQMKEGALCTAALSVRGAVSRALLLAETKFLRAAGLPIRCPPVHTHIKTNWSPRGLPCRCMLITLQPAAGCLLTPAYIFFCHNSITQSLPTNVEGCCLRFD